MVQFFAALLRPQSDLQSFRPAIQSRAPGSIACSGGIVRNYEFAPKVLRSCDSCTAVGSFKDVHFTMFWAPWWLCGRGRTSSAKQRRDGDPKQGAAEMEASILSCLVLSRIIYLKREAK